MLSFIKLGLLKISLFIIFLILLSDVFIILKRLFAHLPMYNYFTLEHSGCTKLQKSQNYAKGIKNVIKTYFPLETHAQKKCRMGKMKQPKKVRGEILTKIAEL